MVTVVPWPRLARDGELVHEPAHPGQSQAQPAVRAEAVVEGRSDVGDARARRRGPRSGSPRRGVVEQLDDDLTRAGEPHDVAAHLGDGRRDDASGRWRPKSRRAASSRAAPRAATMSGSAAMGMRRLSSRCCPRSRSGWLRRAHGLALEEVLGGAHLTLAPLVAAAQGDEHRAAPVGRRFHPLQGEEVLDAQSRPGAVELRGDGAGACCPARAARVRVSVPLTSWSSRVRRSRSDSRASAVAMADCSSSSDDLGIRGVGRAEVDHAMLVAPLAVGVAPHRGHDVAGRHDRVRLEHARLDRRGGGEHPGQRLLDEVLRGRMRADAGVDDASDHGYQRRHLAAHVDVGGGRLMARGSALAIDQTLRHGYGHTQKSAPPASCPCPQGVITCRDPFTDSRGDEGHDRPGARQPTAGARPVARAAAV